MTIKWLNRELIIGPYLVLCTSQKEFEKILKHLRIQSNDKFLLSGERGKHWEFENSENHQRISIVCIDPGNLKDDDEIAGILVHESTHV